MRKIHTLSLAIAVIVATVLSLCGAGVYAGEATGPVYQTGRVIDSKTNKGVPGVPLVLTVSYSTTYNWTTGYKTVIYSNVQQNALTDADGNYKSLGATQYTSWFEEDINTVMIKVEKRYYQFLSPVVQTTGLTTISSDGYNVNVRPTTIYNNRIDVPLAFVNTEISYGFNNLSKFLHNVSSGSYALVCAQPTVNLTAGTPGQVQFTFTLSGKYNNVSIGNATAVITVPVALKEVNGGFAPAIDWALANLSVSGFPSQHITNVANIINAQLEHTIYLAPATYSGNAISVPTGGCVWTELSLSSVEITSSNIRLNIDTGWYVANAIGVIPPPGGGGGGGGGGPLPE